MKITDTAEGTLIEFSKQTNSKVNVILYAEAFLSLIGAIAFLLIAISELYEPGDHLFITIIIACLSLVFFLAFRRYITKATAKESLLISPHTLCIINNSIFQRSQHQYAITEITEMKFLGKQHMTDHPLKGESFDYLGFQTQQEVINTVHDGGNISFSYNGKQIHFGKSVPSWHAEEIDKLIRKATLGKLYIDNLPEDMEYAV